MTPPPTFNQKYGPLYRELETKVNDYFAENRLEKTGNAAMLARILFLGIIFTAAYIFWLVLGTNFLITLIITPILGLSMGMLAALSHEATHGVLSSKRWVNRLMIRFIDLMGASSAYYARSHALHHMYTNVEGADKDIDFGGILRYTPDQPHSWIHRFQYLYAPVLYCCSAFLLIFDLRGWQAIANRGRKTKLAFWLNKTFHVLALLLLPVVLLGPLSGIIGYGISMLIAGTYLSLVVQPGHIFENAYFPQPDDINTLPEEWAVYMIRTGANYAPNNRWVNAVTAGLSHHLIHSLFPKISHVHYPALNPIIQEVVVQHGLEYREFPSWRAIFASHIRHLKEMGQKRVAVKN